MALEITAERVHAAASRLADGGWRFTERQLYYAVCREIEVPATHVAPGELSLGAVLILVGALTGNRIALAVLGALGAVLLVVGAATHIAERRPLPEGRVLALSFDTFHAEHIVGHHRDGLIDASTGASGATQDTGTVVLVDRPDTAALMRANAAQVGVDIRVEESGTLDAVGPAGTWVVTLHDASPGGCALAADARDHGLAVADAGLNPRDVIGHRVQLIEGAPARMPRDLSASLDRAEVDWLTAGRRVELATLTPEEVVSRVRAALRVAAGTPAGGDQENP